MKSVRFSLDFQFSITIFRFIHQCARTSKRWRFQFTRSIYSFVHLDSLWLLVFRFVYLFCICRVYLFKSFFARWTHCQSYSNSIFDNFSKISSKLMKFVEIESLKRHSNDKFNFDIMLTKVNFSMSVRCDRNDFVMIEYDNESNLVTMCIEIIVEIISCSQIIIHENFIEYEIDRLYVAMRRDFKVYIK